MQVLKFLLIFSQKFRILYRKVLIIDIPRIITNAKISKWMFLCQPPILYDPCLLMNHFRLFGWLPVLVCRTSFSWSSWSLRDLTCAWLTKFFSESCFSRFRLRTDISIKDSTWRWWTQVEFNSRYWPHCHLNSRKRWRCSQYFEWVRPVM